MSQKPDLSRLSHETEEKLRKTFSLIGFDAATCDKKISALIDQVFGLFSDAIAAEEAEASRLQKEIESFLSQIDLILEELGDRVILSLAAPSQRVGTNTDILLSG